MHQDTTWYGGRPQPMGLLCYMGTHTHPPQKGGGAPKFSAHVYCYVISLEHCTVVVGLFKFKFLYSVHSIGFNESGRELNH